MLQCYSRASMLSMIYSADSLLVRQRHSALLLMMWSEFHDGPSIQFSQPIVVDPGRSRWERAFWQQELSVVVSKIGENQRTIGGLTCAHGGHGKKTSTRGD